MRKTISTLKKRRALQAMLIEARRAAGLSQLALARRLGRHQSYVARYERGSGRLNVVDFIKIAEALGRDPVRMVSALIKKIE